MFRGDQFFGTSRSDWVQVSSRDDYEERLRALQRIEKVLGRLWVKRGPSPYDGTYIEGEILYRVQSIEAREAAKSWLEKKIIRSGKVNRMKGNRRDIEEI